MSYIVRGVTIMNRQAAQDFAVTIALANPGDGIPIWTRPFHAVAIIRHDDGTGDTLAHKIDRYGRELPGTRVEEHTS